MASQGLATRNTGTILMTSSKKTHEYGWLEAKQSGGAVYEQGVRESKKNKAIRRIAEPLMKKHWHDKVANLHRIYRVAEYILARQRRAK